MNESASPAGNKPAFDSSRLFELEAEIRSGANNLIFLSSVTLLCGLWFGPLLATEGATYLLLAIVLRVKQSRAAALALFFAAVAALVQVVVALLVRKPSDPIFIFAIPEVAPFVAGWTAFKAFRFQRLLKAPLGPVRPRVGGV